MKLLELQLIAFGAFTDCTIDLSGGTEGLHLVYGDNEAGKSTALAALTHLLYGFGQRTTFDFRHKASDLRIGGRIADGQGEELAFVRRKGRKATILSPDGDPLGDDALAPYLHGVDQDGFRRMFGLDHAGLKEGGREILAGRGEVGESLFAAGLGSAGLLRDVRQRLEQEAGDLFLPRGQIPRINRAAAEYEAARKIIRECQLRSQDWTDLQEQLEEAEREGERLQEELARHRREKTRLERIQRLGPVVGALEKAEADRAAMGDVVLLPDTFADDRRNAKEQLKGSMETAREAEAEIDQLEQELEALEAPELLLGARAEISRLHEALGEYRKNGRDLPLRIGEQQEKNEKAAQRLEEIRPGHPLAEAAALRPGARQKGRIRTLIKDHQKKISGMEATGKAIREAEAELDLARSALAELGDPPDTGDLQQAVKRASRLGDIEKQRDEHDTKSARGEQVCGEQLKRLQGWPGSLPALLEAGFPAVETVERFEKKLEAAEEQAKQTTAEIETSRAGLEEAERGLKQLESSGAVPLEQDLVERRKHRDRGWRLVRRAWEKDDVTGDEIEAYSPGRPLAEAYEHQVAQADDVVDRLRRESDRVSKAAMLTTDIHELGLKITSLTGRLEQEAQDLAEINGAWETLWADHGVSPLTPREMKGWLERVARIIEIAETFRSEQEKSKKLSEKIEEARESLGAALTAAGTPALADDESLERVLDRAEQALQQLQGVASEHAELEKRLKRQSDLVARKRQEAVDEETGLEQWTAEWERALADAALDTDLQPDETYEVLESLEKLFRLVDESDQLQERIDGMRAERNDFEAEVRQLLEQLGPDLSDLPEGLELDQAIQWLHTKVEAVGQTAARRSTKEEALEKEQARLRKARSLKTTAGETLEALCRQAGCSSPEDLPELEELSREARSLDQAIDNHRSRLAEESAGRTVADTMTEVKEVDADSLPALVEAAGAQITDLDQRRENVANERGQLQERLKTMERERPATEAAEEAESALARLREAVRRYLPVRLAQNLLSREIEAYRERHQAPLVKRAGALFGTLTTGSFATLATEFLEDDKPVLVGVRPSEERVNVEQMSDGTRDQLFLALRLASLEMHLSNNAPIPLVVDDILINFDDRRARAGLTALAELSTQTQVILFTHHRRILELAEDSVPKNELFVTELG